MREDKFNQTEEQIVKIVDDYIGGKSICKLEEELGISDYILGKILIRENVVLRDPSERCKRYFVDSDYFSIINTEFKAYFLGLFYADGHVNDTNFSELLLCGEEEREIIEKLRVDCQFTGQVTTKKKLKERYKQPYRLGICDKKFRDNLVRQGCIPRKSLILQFPTRGQVPKNLMHHFLRGFWDGDGAISFKKNKQLLIGALTSVDFAKQLKDFLFIELGIYAGNYQRNKSSDVKMCGFSAIKFLDYLYKDATIFFERKKKNYSNYLDHLMNRLQNKSGFQALKKSYVKKLCEYFGFEYIDDYNYKMSKETREKIIVEYLAGKSVKEIMAEYNCSVTAVRRLLDRSKIKKRSNQDHCDFQKQLKLQS